MSVVLVLSQRSCVKENSNPENKHERRPHWSRCYVPDALFLNIFVFVSMFPWDMLLYVAATRRVEQGIRKLRNTVDGGVQGSRVLTVTERCEREVC